MIQNKILPIMVMILLVISGFLFYYSMVRVGPDASPSQEMTVKLNKQSQITGDIEDVYSVFIQAASEEQATLGTGAEEKIYITSDSQEISNFGQSADNYEF